MVAVRIENSVDFFHGQTRFIPIENVEGIVIFLYLPVYPCIMNPRLD